MKNKIRIAAGMVFLIALLFLCRKAGDALWENALLAEETSGKVSGEKDRPLVILDPGHGGIDGGKQGVNGVEEKTVNLQIAFLVKDLLEKENFMVEMTRTDDNRLSDSQAGDLKKRTQIMNSRNPELVVSIHQNSYHKASVSGAQVFYYTDSKQGKQAAEMIQQTLRELDPQNTKEAKANNTYYILKKTEVPVVIVESGFLSNYEEAEKLADASYQKKIAEAIADGTISYIKDKER